MRAVVDVNVLISAAISAEGAPARVMRAWLDGGFELIVSPLLLDELHRALGYPKLRKRISEAEGRRYLEDLAATATLADDPSGDPPIRSSDPSDDYLLALASDQDAYLVSGDQHLLSLSEDAPVASPSQFLAMLKGERG